MNTLRSVVLSSALLLGAPALAAPDTLRKAFGPRFDVGVAVHVVTNLKAEELLIVTNHFTTLTPENFMKPSLLHPEEDRWNFEGADALVAFARSHGLSVNGHTLVWHSQCPAWFFKDGSEEASKELVLERMRRHIAVVAGRYKGKVKSWDVANEVLSDKEGEWLRPSPWSRICGEDFIVEAFLAAKKADPGARLVYNDYNIELPSKRAKTLRLVALLKERGAPIDGIGIQGHYGHTWPTTFAELEDSITAFAEQGLKVSITELDFDVVPRRVAAGADVSAREGGVNDPYVDGLPDEMQQVLATRYVDLFAAVTRHAPVIERVTFWGLHDGKTWLNGWPRRRTNHPLLWDRQARPKPALQAVLEAQAR